MIDDMNNNRYNSLAEYVTKYDDNIDFLASPKDPRQASKIDAKYLDVILDKALFAYDIVIIDTSHIINEINLTVLEKVTNILFMVTNDPYDLNIDNYKILLNNSRDPFKNYFSLYDIKNILKSNIDYTLSNKFYIKNIDDYVIEGKILTLAKKIESNFAKDYTTLVTIATDFYEEKERKEIKDEK